MPKTITLPDEFLAQITKDDLLESYISMKEDYEKCKATKQTVNYCSDDYQTELTELQKIVDAFEVVCEFYGVNTLSIKLEGDTIIIDIYQNITRYLKEHSHFVGITQENIKDYILDDWDFENFNNCEEILHFKDWLQETYQFEDNIDRFSGIFDIAKSCYYSSLNNK